ncbi:MAG: TonB family protein [Hoeflea sp.]|uniref:energy transducer TonB family protein n=1 Tax=Hoeflea sp. TaxID=1940281 RepID=UPI0032F03666
MGFRRGHILAAVAASVSLHVAVAGWFVPADPEMQIAGGSAVDLMIVGNAFVDAVSAGAQSDEISPVEPVEADETVEAETADAAEVESGTAEPVAEETSTPAETAAEMMPELTETVDAVPTQPTLEVAAVNEHVLQPEPLRSMAPDDAVDVPAIEPVETDSIEAVEATPEEKVEEELAALRDIPVPSQRPRIEPRPEPRQTVAKKPKPAEARQKRKAAPGNGGTQKADSSRSASGAKEARKPSRAGNAAVSNYPGKVASQLRRGLRYPREARREGIKGTVVVSFTVARNGSVRGVRIARSSGSALLDRAARDAVNRAAPFRPIPDAAGRSSWSFSVPLAFTR